MLQLVKSLCTKSSLIPTHTRIRQHVYSSISKSHANTYDNSHKEQFSKHQGLQMRPLYVFENVTLIISTYVANPKTAWALYGNS